MIIPVPIMMPMQPLTGELPEWVVWFALAVLAITLGLLIWAIIELLKE